MASENSADPNEADVAREERLREESVTAFLEGRFDASFNRMQQAGLDEAIRWFREEGLTFAKVIPNMTPLEMILGLRAAANEEVQELGDTASDKLLVAAGYLQALAEFRLALERPVAASLEAVAMRTAELSMKAMVLGEMEGLAKAIRLGWFDKMAAFERDRERRRLGAEKVNSQKATVRGSTLAEAMRLVGKNPTLSNEDVASKVRDILSLPTTIKTLTGWVRDWRKEDFLPPQKKV